MMMEPSSSGAPQTVPLALDALADLSPKIGPLHLAIGIFDGVHMGHKAVIRSATTSAVNDGALSGVLTFHPHPSHLFKPEDPTRMLMDIETKTKMLHQSGVDLVIRQSFDPEFAAITADQFLLHLKRFIPRLSAVFVGENFRFGKRRLGDVSVLIETGKPLGIAVYSADRLKHNGSPISSTRIRSALESGNLREVNQLLGYHYRAQGKVVGGKKLGRKLGFPTLNLPWAPECLPALGVYRTRIRSTSGGAWADAVSNFGLRPTVEQAPSAPLLETHVLGDTSLKSGDAVEIEWLDFIRSERKFDSVDSLKAQIAEDRAAVLGQINHE